jgi:hypothetical protein
MNFISKIKQSYSALDRIQQFACHLDDSGRVIWANKKLCEHLKQFEISLEGLPFVEVFSKVSKLNDEDIKTDSFALPKPDGMHVLFREILKILPRYGWGGMMKIITRWRKFSNVDPESQI